MQEISIAKLHLTHLICRHCLPERRQTPHHSRKERLSRSEVQASYKGDPSDLVCWQQ